MATLRDLGKRCSEAARRWRRPLTVGAWVVALAWSAYLVATAGDGGGGGFGVAVRVLGSIGILYALFLALRPPDAGPPNGGGAGEAGHQPPRADRRDAGRWGIVLLVVALTIGSVGYRMMQGEPLHQTSAFFIGLPALMAMTLALTPKTRSATGTIVKGLTLALLLSGIVLAEGFVCILMASPLVYLVGILVGAPIDYARRRRPQQEMRIYSVVGLGMLALSMQGVVSGPESRRLETATATRIVTASPSEVRAQLASTPVFDEDLPLYLRLGFPRPRVAYGRGLARGDVRTIVFGAESPMESMEPAGAGGGHTHDPAPAAPALELEVVATRPGRVVFEPTRDATAFTHWIGWGRSVVEWRSLGEGRTQVTWTLSYRRRLSPAWYFAPWQRYAMRLATGYLLETVATP